MIFAFACYAVSWAALAFACRKLWVEAELQYNRAEAALDERDKLCPLDGPTFDPDHKCDGCGAPETDETHHVEHDGKFICPDCYMKAEHGLPTEGAEVPS